MEEYIEVRCMACRPHMVKGMVKQDCGSLLLGVSEDDISDVVVKCKVCKTDWHVVSECGVITIDIVDEMNLKR